MAAVPVCKIQLLVRKQKAVEQYVGDKKDQMAQEPVQKWVLLKKSYTKLGVPEEEPGFGHEVICEAPPLEVQGCVSGREKTKEQRSGPKDQKQSWVKRKKERENGKSLGVAEVPEQSLRPTETLEGRVSPKETEERSWEKSSRGAQEQNKNLVEPQEQASGGSEMRLNLEEESKGSSGKPRTEQNKFRKKSRFLKTQEFQLLSSEVMEAAERRLISRGNVSISSGWKKVQITLNSGKALEWCLWGSGPKYEKFQSPKAAGIEGRMARSLPSHSSGTSFFPLKKVRTGNSGPQQPLPPSVPLLAPAPPTQESPKSFLKNLEMQNSLESRPQATSLLPKPQLSDSENQEYPTSEEISVIGGYISLNRSCLAKSSSKRSHKQLRISFKEPVVQSIYYYSSEKSMLQDIGSIVILVSSPRKHRRRRRNSCHNCQGNMGKN